MHNDFILVGPAADPAGVAAADFLADAMTRIANSDAGFISRGDDSGTYKKEMSSLASGAGQAGVGPGTCPWARVWAQY